MLQSSPITKQNSISSSDEKTFDEVLNMWVENNRIKNKGATVTKYQNLIDAQISPSLGKMKVSI